MVPPNALLSIPFVLTHSAVTSANAAMASSEINSVRAETLMSVNATTSVTDVHHALIQSAVTLVNAPEV